VLLGIDIDFEVQELKLADFGMVQRKGYMLSQKSFYSESCEEETKCNKDETGFDDFNNYLVE